jgi:hypothetical protein
MSREQYVRRAAAEQDWAPGWLAIDEAFERHYPGVVPRHLASDLPSRAVLGGDQYLDGISLYPSPHGHQHLLTYGMSCLYADVDSYGGEESGWGYEMTMRVAATSADECGWAVNSLINLARYTYTSGGWLEPYQYISGRGNPLRAGSDTRLTSYLVVPDPEIQGIDTVHGRVEFPQLVGIMQDELDWVAGAGDAARARAGELADRIAAQGNPLLVTDLDRATSYV